MFASKPPLVVVPLLLPPELAPLDAPELEPTTTLPLLLLVDASVSPSSLSLAHPPTMTRVTMPLRLAVARSVNLRGWRLRFTRVVFYQRRGVGDAFFSVRAAPTGVFVVCTDRGDRMWVG